VLENGGASNLIKGFNKMEEKSRIWMRGGIRQVEN
jgi:hypothetical protein